MAQRDGLAAMVENDCALSGDENSRETRDRTNPHFCVCEHIDQGGRFLSSWPSKAIPAFLGKQETTMTTTKIKTIRGPGSNWGGHVNLEPPSGSRISVTTDGGHPRIVIPHGNDSPMRYFIGLFMLAWLGGWFAGFSNEVSKLSSGQPDPIVVFWLVGWTLGGAFAMYLAYRAFRRCVPESLRLMPNSVTYDSGIPPLQVYGYSRKDYWKSVFPKRTRVELDWRKLQSLHLRETNDGNRLTVDADAVRLDITQSASEIEREWLYQLLATRYSLRAWN
jgi:hypothetical protein